MKLAALTSRAVAAACEESPMKPKSLTYPVIVSGDMSDPNVLKSETAKMLAKEALSFAEYYGDVAAPYKNSEPDEYEFIRQKADAMNELVEMLLACAGNVSPGDHVLVVGALIIAENAENEKDFGLAKEMTSLANSIAGAISRGAVYWRG